MRISAVISISMQDACQLFKTRRPGRTGRALHAAHLTHFSWACTHLVLHADPGQSHSARRVLSWYTRDFADLARSPGRTSDSQRDPARGLRTPGETPALQNAGRTKSPRNVGLREVGEISE